MMMHGIKIKIKISYSCELICHDLLGAFTYVLFFAFVEG